MSRCTGRIPDDVFGVVFPGWTKEAYSAFVNSPANKSADRVFKLATQLRQAIRRHLAKHTKTEAEIVAAAGVEVPPQLAEVNGNRVLHVRHHLGGFLYALSEFLLNLPDLIPDPDDLSDDVGFLIPVPDAEYATGKGGGS